MLAADFGSALSGKDPAVGGPECLRHSDPGDLPGDLLRAALRIRMREIWRAAEHRDHEAPGLDHRPNPRPLLGVGQFEEPAVEFQAVDSERRGEFYPFAKAHRAFPAELAHEGLRERGEPGHGKGDQVFAGLRPYRLNCSKSTTDPVIGRDSSESQKTAAEAISSGVISLPEGAKTRGTCSGQSAGSPRSR